MSRRRREKRQPRASVGRPEPAGPQKAPDEIVELSVQRSVRHFQGPLPPPQTLAQYETTLPGCAERIVSMAEKQAAHRRALETRVITKNLATERLGQIFAFALALVVIAIGGVLIYLGKDAGGLTTIIGHARGSGGSLRVRAPQG